MSLFLQTVPDATGPLARIEPRCKLAAAGFAIIVWICLRNPSAMLAAFALSLFLLIASGIPRAWLFVKLSLVFAALMPFLLVVPFVVQEGRTVFEWRFLRATDDGIVLAYTLVLRAAGIACWAMWLLATTTWTDGFHAARRLGMPRRVASVLLLSHRHIGVMFAELQTVRRAMRIRGFDNRMDGYSIRTLGQLIGGFFVRGADRAEAVHAAMRSRGFAGELPVLRKPAIRRSDVLFLVSVFVLFASILLFDLFLRR